VHDAGGFGILAGGNMPPELLDKELDRCSEGLTNPYAVNLITIAPNFEEHKEVIKSKDVPFVVFAGNFPKRKDVEEIKATGKRVLSFASTMSIANQMLRFGVDGLMLEGSEAGGHIGHVSLTILLQQVLFENPGVPVFVAGGIATGKMMAHLLLMGAAGVQLGTRFVMSDECNAHPRFKEAFVRARAREAMETPQYDKRLPVVAVRALKNKANDEFGQLQLKLLEKLNRGEISRHDAQYQVESFWMGGLRKAVVDGDVEEGSVMAGQSVGLCGEIMPIAAILDELVTDAEAELVKTRERLL
jgi:enoyl-[acyl-carrier protein] reductase II